jgi:hypothetical protein
VQIDMHMTNLMLRTCCLRIEVMWMCRECWLNLSWVVLHRFLCDNLDCCGDAQVQRYPA